MIKRGIKHIFHTIGLEIRKYSPPNYKWLYDKNINTVLDIGTNTGQFAQKITQIIPKALIHSFEPILSCFQGLKANTNHLNIHHYNYALGDDNYETEINISSHSPSTSIREMDPLHKEVYDNTKNYTRDGDNSD